MAEPSSSILAISSLEMSQSSSPTISTVDKAMDSQRPNATAQRSHNAFHPFPRLPTEIRLKIWGHALPENRVIEIEWCLDCGEWFCPKESQPLGGALSAACTESRAVFMKGKTPFLKQGSFLKRGVNYSHNACLHNLSKSPSSYIDFEKDIIYIGPIPRTWAINSDSLIAFSCLKFPSELSALAFNCIEWKEGTNEQSIDILASFPFLKTFISVVGDDPFIGSEYDKPSGEIRLVPLLEDRDKKYNERHDNEITFDFLRNKGRDEDDRRARQDMKFEVMQVERAGKIMNFQR